MIRDFNPWWNGKEIVVPSYKRHLFKDIQKYLRTKQIIAIVGLRRVGKTVLMKQIIKNNLGIKNKENFFYFLFDELIAQNPDIFEEILDYYLKTISKEGKKFIFLDEIQKIPYWQDIIKRFYDTKEDVKFMISGSASLQIKKSKESLAGRIYDFYMPILTFSEFLELNEMGMGDISEFEFDELKKFYDLNISKKPAIEEQFFKYILKGAFPELVKENDEEIIKNYIRSSVIEKIILEDIPSVFEVKRKDILSSLVEYCSKETSNLLNVTNLASVMKVNYQTIKLYLFYLSNSFLIDILYNYSKSITKQLRKNKKIHIAHPSITLTIMRYSKDILNVEEVISKYVETIIFQHSKIISERIFFWRTPQKEEVDIILELNNTIPIEVKYKNKINNSDFKSIIKFIKKHKLNFGIVVTKHLLEKRKVGEKNIFLVPAWLFLLVNKI